jgi:glucose-1-phosphate adenylyltransferase
MATLQANHLGQHPKIHHTPAELSCDMSRVATIILGGGQGSRLYPLTRSDCKPAVTFGGKYRLIDVPMSNSIHSGCHKIFIVTQFLSKTLHDHIFKTYRPGTFTAGFVEVLSVEEKPHTKAWFQGTADAIRQNLEYLTDVPIDYFLILSGDQLYQMDYKKMMQVAQRTNADVVIATLPIEESQASRFGILKIDHNERITEFVEKPTDKEQIKTFKVSESTLKKFHLKNNKDGACLGSMGIYLFKRKALLKLLLTDMREDFGKHLIPNIIKNGNAAAYLYDGYWEDIGTIESYYHANLALTEDKPEFNWYDEKHLLVTNSLNLPAAKIYNTKVQQSIICEGSVIEAKEVFHSILGPRTQVGTGTVIKDCYILGNDHYRSPMQDNQTSKNYQIGQNCLIERAIIDKHACIGNNVCLNNADKLTHYTSNEIFIRDGIIIVPRGACIPDGFTL